MARHKPQNASRDTHDVPAIPGGAAGLPTEETSRQTPQARRSDEPEHVATQYMITDGPRDQTGSIPFNSDGYIVKLRPGKIVSETTHDLELMRRQGIKLEPMPQDDAPDSGPADDENPPEEDAREGANAS